MHSKWIKYFLLLTFAWWATGSAKYFHELVEHHGGGDNCLDDDDDDSPPQVAIGGAIAGPVSGQIAGVSSPQPAPVHGDQDCVVCKNLAAMAVDQPVPILVPEPSSDEIAILILHDWIPPVVRCEFIHPTTGPPISIHI